MTTMPDFISEIFTLRPTDRRTLALSAIEQAGYALTEGFDAIALELVEDAIRHLAAVKEDRR